jgi:hypothetical protein
VWDACWHVFMDFISDSMLPCCTLDCCVCCCMNNLIMNHDCYSVFGWFTLFTIKSIPSFQFEKKWMFTCCNSDLCVCCCWNNLVMMHNSYSSFGWNTLGYLIHQLRGKCHMIWEQNYSEQQLYQCYFGLHALLCNGYPHLLFDLYIKLNKNAVQHDPSCLHTGNA